MKNYLNKLESKLNSRRSPDIIDVGRSDFVQENNNDELSKNGWIDENESKLDSLAYYFSDKVYKKSSFIRKFFVGALVLFVLSTAGSIFMFFGGINFVSSQNVDIKVLGPTSIAGGQETSFELKIINNNNVALQSASLFVEYPVGTKSKKDSFKELSREKFSIERIDPGATHYQTIEPVFFGEKESIKEIKISLEYRVEKSSAIFLKEKKYELSISSAPIIISLTYPKEINANQNISLDVEIASNSQDSIQNLLLQVEYPFGFVFKDASVAPFADNNLWFFKELKSGEKKKFSIRGSILGQDNEEKVFRVNAGTSDDEDNKLISVNIVNLTESILIKKPFLSLSMDIGGEDGDYFGKGGESVGASIKLQNNLSSKIYKNNLKISFSGNAFDQLSVIPNQGGFFSSSDNAISWNLDDISNFDYIEPGDTRKVSFKITPRNALSLKFGSKPEVLMEIKATSERVLDSGSVEKIESSLVRKIVLITDLSMSTKTLRSVGNLENSGLVPPKVNTNTLYTVNWSFHNTFNQVNDVEARTKLPPYVRWTDEFYPKEEKIYFDSNTNEVVWRAGVVPSNTTENNLKKVYFQLEFLPSTSQIGTTPNLTGEINFIGRDKITGVELGNSISPATINFASDPTFKMGDDKVIP